MTTTDERLQILRMVEQGKISAEDGSRLLEALSAGERRRSQISSMISACKAISTG